MNKLIIGSVIVALIIGTGLVVLSSNGDNTPVKCHICTSEEEVLYIYDNTSNNTDKPNNTTGTIQTPEPDSNTDNNHCNYNGDKSQDCLLPTVQSNNPRP